jgi:holo-[acyl-carrier protein] synthase
MILGIGVDVVQVSRMNAWLDQKDLLYRFFHDDEVSDSLSRGGDAVTRSLAARFAAKEAFGKAIGTGLREFSLKEVQVMNDDLGKPQMLLHGNARQALRRHGGGRVHLSLTHEIDNAVAMVLIEEASA